MWTWGMDIATQQAMPAMDSRITKDRCDRSTVINPDVGDPEGVAPAVSSRSGGGRRSIRASGTMVATTTDDSEAGPGRDPNNKSVTAQAANQPARHSASRREQQRHRLAFVRPSAASPAAS